MLKRIKKLFLFGIKNKKMFLAFLLLIIIGIILPLKPAFAAEGGGWFGLPSLGDIKTSVVNAILAIPSLYMAANYLASLSLSAIFASLSIGFFRAVTSKLFLGDISYTNPSNNEIIRAGLGVTQGFTNMALVLILVFIALAIILGLKDYEAKKILPTFIIVALLVNFGPVLSGLIVDFANILMYYFLDNIGNFGGIIGTLKAEVSFITAQFEGGEITKITGYLASLGPRIIALTVLNYTLALFFFIYTLIFFLRYVAIWFLVILSPLAFVCFILPRTNKYFWQWLDHLIDWSFIGVIYAFVIYLAEKSIAIPVNITGFSDAEYIKIGQLILQNGFPVAILFLGLLYGFATKQAGANTLIMWGRQKGKNFGKSMWETGKTAARNIGGAALGTKAGQKITGAMSRMPTVKEAAAMPGAAKKAAAIIGSLTGINWAARKLGGAGATYGASQEKSIEVEKKKIQENFGKDYKRAASTYSSIPWADYNKKIALARYLSETKGGKAFGELTNKQQREVIKLTNKYSPSNTEDLIKLDPTLIDDPEIGKIALKVNSDWNSPEAIIEDMKPDDYKNITKVALDDTRVANAMIKNAMGVHISKLIESHGRKEGAKPLEKALRNLAFNQGKNPEEYLQETNRSLYNYLTKGAGIGLIDLSPTPTTPSPKGPTAPPTPPGGPAPSPGPSGFTGPGAGPATPPSGGPPTSPPPPPSGGPTRGGFSGPGTAPPGPAMGMGNIPPSPPPAGGPGAGPTTPPSGGPATPPPPSGGPGRGGFFGPGTTPPGPGAQTTTKIQQDALKSVLKDIGLTDEEIEKIKSRSDLNKITGLKKVQDKAVDILKKHKVKDRQIKSMGIKKTVLKAIEILVKEKIDQMNKNK